MRAEIRRIQQTLGITSVYVTHDQGEAMTLSDRIVVMNQGRIVQIGTAHQIYRRPANAFVADFIGKANFLSARVVGAAPGRLDLDVLGQQLSIPPPEGAPGVGESVTLLVRPEAVILHVNGDGYPGRVSRVAYLGPIVEYDVEVAGVVLSLTQYNPREVHPVGSEVGVQLVKGALYLLPRESDK
jgi:iron(III) transport system ATP-binding protein